MRFFRHALAATAAVLALLPRLAGAQASVASAPAVSYDKGFVLEANDFSLKVAGRVQSRWDLAKSTADGAEIEHKFSIPRFRLTLDGHAYGVEYKMQTEFGKGFVFLRDGYLDKTFGPVHVRTGQWKRPFSRQQITSSGSLQFVDRSITDEWIGAGRDIGLAVHNGYEKSPMIEWALGVFNGTGDKSKVSCTVGEDDMMMPTASCGLPTNVPRDIGPTVVARVGYNHGGIKGYSESDLEGGPFRLAVGASYQLDLADGKSDDFVQRADVDAIVKVAGASLTGAVYLLETGEADPELGFHAQAGYFVMPKTLEVGARFGQVPAGDDDRQEILGNLSWFFHGHQLKWQTSGGVFRTTSDPTTTTLVVLTQAQLIF